MVQEGLKNYTTHSNVAGLLLFRSIKSYCRWSFANFFSDVRFLFRLHLISMRHYLSLYANFRSSCTYLFRMYVCMVIYMTDDAHASEICVTGGGYSRLGFICVYTCLRRLRRVCANEQKPAAIPARYLSQISLLPLAASKTFAERD